MQNTKNQSTLPKHKSATFNARYQPLAAREAKPANKKLEFAGLTTMHAKAI
jgi:hypothetical protein